MSYNTSYPGYVNLHIYFEEIAYTALNQEPAYPAMSLFGEVGGMLGLFIGSSALSITEFIDLILVYLIRF